MPSPAPSASRRAVISGGGAAGIAAVALLSGCGSSRASDPAGTAGDDPTAPAVDADRVLVEKVGDQLRSALALALATGASVPQLRPLARRFAGLHRAHLRELSRSDDVEDGQVGGSVDAARARLLRSEERLQQRLVRAALAAESGALAQVFASMAAAVAQRRAVET